MSRKIKKEEYVTWNLELSKVLLSEEVLQVIQTIRQKIASHNQNLRDQKKALYVSDRRWKKIAKVLKTSAYLNEREKVDLMDCFLIQHCIWNEESQISKAKEIVSEAIEKYGYSLTVDIEGLENKIKKFREEVEGEYFEQVTVPIIYKNNSGQTYLQFQPSQELQNLQNQFGVNVDCLLETDFKLLNPNQFNSFSVWNTSFQRQLNVSLKKIDEFTLEYYNNWNRQSFRLKLQTKKEKKQKKRDDINPRLKEAFEKEVSSILSEIQNQISTIENHRQVNLPHLQTNLFVDKEYSKIVEKNLHESIQKLNDLKLETEKIQGIYVQKR